MKMLIFVLSSFVFSLTGFSYGGDVEEYHQEEQEVNFPIFTGTSIRYCSPYTNCWDEYMMEREALADGINQCNQAGYRTGRKVRHTFRWAFFQYYSQATLNVECANN